MTKRTTKTLANQAEERFLLQSLQRLHTPELRYVFTLMADLLSAGLASHEEMSKGAAKN
jgi:hypothetical protein